MEKNIVIKYGIMIAANELNIEPINYAIDYNGVLKDKDLTRFFNQDRNLIIINGDWLETANNNEILFVAFHEVRHYYQKIRIDLLYNGVSISENDQEIETWRKEFEEYYSPFKIYVNQAIEKDAIGFSRSLIKKIITLIKPI